MTSTAKKTSTQTTPRAPAKAAPKAASKLKSAEPIAAFQPGDVAPNFSLPNEAGEMIRLSDFKNQRVILYFYPKDDTPGCTQESCDFRDSFARLKKSAVVFGISRDSVEKHVKFREKYTLPFSLLSDEEGKATTDYKVWVEKSMYGKKYMGIERTTYVVDVDSRGKATVVLAYPKVKVPGHVDAILKDIR